MSDLLINESPLQVLPSLAVKIGLNEAIVLQQVHYWLKINERAKKHKTHYREGRWWVYNSAGDWVGGNFPWWSVHVVRRILKSLKDQGLLITDRFNKMNYDRTLWYTIDYEALDRLQDVAEDDQTMLQNCKMDVAENDTPIPETNTETNTEIQEDVTHPLGEKNEYLCVEREVEYIPTGKKPTEKEITQDLIRLAELREQENTRVLEYIPAGKEFEKPKRQPTGRNKIKAELTEAFHEITGIVPLPVTSRRDAKAMAVRWWKPLMQIYDLVGGDVERARGVIEHVVVKMLEDGMIISAPQSILNNVISEVARGNREKSKTGDHVRFEQGKRVIVLGE